MEFSVTMFPSWRNTQIASGCFKFLISTGSIPSLPSRAPHPSHNFSSLQIPGSPTFINTCHQSQRTCLFFLPFSPHIARVSQSIQIFKHSLVNIYWLLNLSISLPTHKDWKPLDQSNHWSTPLLHLSSVKTFTQPWNLASGRNMVSNSDQVFGVKQQSLLYPWSAPLPVITYDFFTTYIYSFSNFFKPHLSHLQ